MGFDMDNAGKIESSLRKPAIGFLDQIILENLNIKGVEFFSSRQDTDIFHTEEGFIYIPDQISEDELTIRLKKMRDAIQMKTQRTILTRETVTFSAIKDDDLAAYIASRVTEAKSPEKEIDAMTSLLNQLLDIGKGGPKLLRASNRNHGNTFILYDRTNGFIRRDQAQVAQNPGGIDLSPDKMNLKVQNNENEIKFHLDPAMLKQLQNAPGFVPMIINIQPLKSLQIFLGLKG